MHLPPCCQASHVLGHWNACPCTQIPHQPNNPSRIGSRASRTRAESTAKPGDRTRPVATNLIASPESRSSVTWCARCVSVMTGDWSPPIAALVDIATKVGFGKPNAHHYELRDLMLFAPHCCMLSDLGLPFNDASPVVARHVWENCQDGAQDHLCDSHGAHHTFT